jgi:hypothetical protein
VRKQRKIAVVVVLTARCTIELAAVLPELSTKLLEISFAEKMATCTERIQCSLRRTSFLRRGGTFRARATEFSRRKDLIILSILFIDCRLVFMIGIALGALDSTCGLLVGVKLLLKGKEVETVKTFQIVHAF